ncbi:uncharacterized protein LOC142239639 [Haematobia irritans]|uniref:uncharacterized protein LOC142239639 n=1 Tax=Haematobia irritans TaxID=7368 RepID=UPI003F5051E8
MSLNTTVALLLLASNASRMSDETIPKMVNSSFLIEVVASIHDLYNFENFVFFVSPYLAVDSKIAQDFLYGFLLHFPMVPRAMMVNTTWTMRGVMRTPCLCLILTTHEDDPIMEVAAQGMHGIRYYKTVFVLFPTYEIDEENNFVEEYIFSERIRVFYEWIWNVQFINSLLVTIDNMVFIQEPYPETRVINLTGNWSGHSFFIPYRNDFKGYVISTPIRHDFPRVFYLTRLPKGLKIPHRVSGVSGKLFISFVEHINATFAEYDTNHLETEPVELDRVIEMVNNKELEISLHTYTDMLKITAGNSYPIGINDWCIMVPFLNRSNEYSYLRKSFRSFSWILLCMAIIYVTLGIWLCCPPHERDVSLCLLQAISSMLNILPLRMFTLPNHRLRFLYLLLFIWGFFITNLYVSKMASYLTASPTKSQIDTVEDVIQAKLPIMIMSYEYEVLKAYNFSKEFLDLVVNASTKGEMDEHRDNFNTSYGYSTQTDRWVFASLQQRFLKTPLFRLSKICIGPFYHVFPMHRDCHYQKPLEAFIVAASEVGLMTYWEREAFADALYLGYIHMLTDNVVFKPLRLNFFRSILLVWWLGLIISSVILCLEIKGIDWPKIKSLCWKVFQVIREKIHKFWNDPTIIRMRR